MVERADNIRALPTMPTAMPRVRRASSIAPERVKWISPGRLAAGKITVLDGDPGLGKSQIAIDWAARVSTGRALPGAEGWTNDHPVGASRGVVLLSAEDGEGDTIIPRLIAAQADLNRVFLMMMVDEDDNEFLPTLDANLAAIEAQIEATNSALLVIDPLMAYLGGEVNANRDQDVRRVLSPLASMASRTGCAILVLRHLNKASGMSSLYRGGGSIGIIGAARVGLLAAKDDDDPSGQRRVLAVQKCNIGPEGPSLLYHVAPHAETSSSSIEWLGESAKTASEILGPVQDAEERDTASEAELWLLDTLGGVGPAGMEVQELFRQGTRMGFKEKTLRRAKAKIGVKVMRHGFGAGGSWVWALPPEQLTRANQGTSTPIVRTASDVAPDLFADDAP